eukprot:GILJ01005230.1.p1 GENE.GILJ01005230.1~~GILJ01005230.1.p1  ORF type:complete len:653 (-),score=84.75 GILJ01005230.1:69-2027(-)
MPDLTNTRFIHEPATTHLQATIALCLLPVAVAVADGRSRSASALRFRSSVRLDDETCLLTSQTPSIPENKTMFEDSCGSFDTDTPVCCSAVDTERVQSDTVDIYEDVYRACPGCIKNIQAIQCALYCSANMKSFTNVTRDSYGTVTKVTVKLCNNFCDGWFASCADIPVPGRLPPYNLVSTAYSSSQSFCKAAVDLFSDQKFSLEFLVSNGSDQCWSQDRIIASCDGTQYLTAPFNWTPWIIAGYAGGGVVTVLIIWLCFKRCATAIKSCCPCCKKRDGKKSANGNAGDHSDDDEGVSLLGSSPSKGGSKTNSGGGGLSCCKRKRGGGSTSGAGGVELDTGPSLNPSKKGSSKQSGGPLSSLLSCCNGRSSKRNGKGKGKGGSDWLAGNDKHDKNSDDEIEPDHDPKSLTTSKLKIRTAPNGFWDWICCKRRPAGPVKGKSKLIKKRGNGQSKGPWSKNPSDKTGGGDMLKSDDDTEYELTDEEDGSPMDRDLLQSDDELNPDQPWDPSTLNENPHDSDAIRELKKRLQGYLWKKGRNVFVGWQKRFFALRGDNLVYYRTAEEAANANLRPAGTLPLASIRFIKAHGRSNTKFCVFGVRSQDQKMRKFLLRGANEREVFHWLTGLTAVVENFRKTNLEFLAVQAALSTRPKK